jgi:hypothetical protein
MHGCVTKRIDLSYVRPEPALARLDVLAVCMRFVCGLGVSKAALQDLPRLRSPAGGAGITMASLR